MKYKIVLVSYLNTNEEVLKQIFKTEKLHDYLETTIDSWSELAWVCDELEKTPGQIKITVETTNE